MLLVEVLTLQVGYVLLCMYACIVRHKMIKTCSSKLNWCETSFIHLVSNADALRTHLLHARPNRDVGQRGETFSHHSHKRAYRNPGVVVAKFMG